MADKALSPEVMKLMDKIAGNPTSRLFVPLAEEYLKADMLDEAILVLADGIKNHPTYVAARVMLGKIYLQKKQIAEAKNEFEQVIAVNPENILAGKRLAAIYQSEGELQKAIDACKKILMIDPSDKETKLLFSSLEKEQVASSPIEPPVEPSNAAGADSQPLSVAESFREEAAGAPFTGGTGEEEQPVETASSFVIPSPEPEVLLPSSLPAENMKVEEVPPPPVPDEQKFEVASNGGPGTFDGEAIPDEIKIFDGPLPGEMEGERGVKEDRSTTIQPALDSEEKPVLSDFSEPFATEPSSSSVADPLSVASESNEDLATTTLASLYMDQGHFKEAAEVYRKILARDPSNKECLRGLEYVLQKLNGPHGPLSGPVDSETNGGGRPQGKTQRLQSWLDSIRKDAEE